MFEKQIAELVELKATITADVNTATEMINVKKAEIKKIERAIVTFKSLSPKEESEAPIAEGIDPLWATPIIQPVMPPIEIENVEDVF